MTPAPVLLTWLATRSDRYERIKSGGPFRETAEGSAQGPTLSPLADSALHCENRSTDVVALRQHPLHQAEAGG